MKHREKTTAAACADAHGGCGHDGCGCHCHGHGHEGGKARLWWPLVSFVMLVVGVVASAAGWAWFAAPWVPAVWYAAAFLPVGLPVAHEAREAARQKDVFSEFTLMVLAAVGAFCIGEYAEAVAVMLFYTVGEALQHRAVDSATRNIGRLLDVRPERAAVLRGGRYVEVKPVEVKPGEVIEVKPGGRVPLDGALTDDGAAFDTSALTGESLPRNVVKGGEVLAGMIASGQTVHVRVSRPYEQSALARILTLVRDASSRKAPAELFIRRFARVYTPAVIVAAALVVVVPALVSLLVPSFRYVFDEWLYRGLVFLVLSCPCALVISIPLGYFGGIGAASRAGILFKGGNYLDAITRVNVVAFDKTGTLTTGRFGVTAVHTAQGVEPVALLSCLYAAESCSTHPIARAVVCYAAGRQAACPKPERVKELAGHGMEVVVGGHMVLVGNVRLMAERGVEVPAEVEGEAAATVVACAVDGRYQGCVLLADTLKPDAAQAVRELDSLGVGDVRLLSGDKQAVVQKVASGLGIGKAHGDLLPEDKARLVEELSARPGTCVAFVGDGMNDAPVLALSNVGIAMGGLGSDAAIESADVVLQTDQPSKVATAIRVGRATRSIVWQNIVGAIGVKAVVLVAGALGVASLWAAVFADVGVAMLAVLNSVRILGKRF